MRQAKKIIVKIGTSVLMEPGGNVDMHILTGLAKSIAHLTMNRRQVALVSSGAVNVGSEHLKLSPRMVSVCAAAGQSLLTAVYVSVFSELRLRTGQILLTGEEFLNPQRHTSLRKTLQRMLEISVVPVINENDVVTHTLNSSQERPFSDNDMLASLIAHTIEADLLILLTDVDGLYTNHPDHIRATLISKVTGDGCLSGWGQGRNNRGRGGMQAKLRAAAHAVRGNKRIAVIANGRLPNVLDRLIAGHEIGTLVTDQEER